MAKVLTPVALNLKKCAAELKEFGRLLTRKPELSERKDVLSFFKKRSHLSAFVGSMDVQLGSYDLVGHELQLFGDFSCDLAIGNAAKSTYLFVEFEDGKKTSIFRQPKKKATPEWASRIEHGFGQIVDWLWKLDDLRRTDAVEAMLGPGPFSANAILVIGRSAFLTGRERKRWTWRSKKVVVDSSQVQLLTYDELYEALADRMRLLKTLKPSR
jgi:hypothetical protein